MNNCEYQTFHNTIFYNIINGKLCRKTRYKHKLSYNNNYK